jgi:PD-(D/E)XK nuclease superfamily
MGDLATMVAKATWLVDADRLRSTLDELRAALDSSPPFVPGTQEPRHHHQYQLILESLRTVVDRLASLDLSSTGALDFSLDSKLNLQELFDGLQRGWRERVLTFLGPTKAKIVAELLRSPVPDMLHILGKGGDENAHSALITWLLDPRQAPLVAPHALRRLATHLPEDHWRSLLAEAVATESLSVRREVVIGRDFKDTGDLSRVDIVISAPRFVISIENKVWSNEHGDQTNRYWDWMESMEGVRGGIFLSPSGMTASCSSFVAVSYMELVSCLTEGATIAPLSEGERTVLASYLKTLARKIAQVEMRAILEIASSHRGTE